MPPQHPQPFTPPPSPPPPALPPLEPGVFALQRHFLHVDSQVDGSVEDYNATYRAQLLTSFTNYVGIDRSTVTLDVSAGSVVLSFTIELGVNATHADQVEAHMRGLIRTTAENNETLDWCRLCLAPPTVVRSAATIILLPPSPPPPPILPLYGAPAASALTSSESGGLSTALTVVIAVGSAVLLLVVAAVTLWSKGECSKLRLRLRLQPDPSKPGTRITSTWTHEADAFSHISSSEPTVHPFTPARRARSTVQAAAEDEIKSTRAQPVMPVAEDEIQSSQPDERKARKPRSALPVADEEIKSGSTPAAEAVDTPSSSQHVRERVARARATRMHDLVARANQDTGVFLGGEAPSSSLESVPTAVPMLWPPQPPATLPPPISDDTFVWPPLVLPPPETAAPFALDMVATPAPPARQFAPFYQKNSGGESRPGPSMSPRTPHPGRQSRSVGGTRRLPRLPFGLGSHDSMRTPREHEDMAFDLDDDGDLVVDSMSSSRPPAYAVNHPMTPAYPDQSPAIGGKMRHVSPVPMGVLTVLEDQMAVQKASWEAAEQRAAELKRQLAESEQARHQSDEEREALELQLFAAMESDDGSDGGLPVDALQLPSTPPAPSTPPRRSVSQRAAQWPPRATPPSRNEFVPTYERNDTLFEPTSLPHNVLHRPPVPFRAHVQYHLGLSISSCPCGTSQLPLDAPAAALSSAAYATPLAATAAGSPLPAPARAAQLEPPSSIASASVPPSTPMAAMSWLQRQELVSPNEDDDDAEETSEERCLRLEREINTILRKPQMFSQDDEQLKELYRELHKTKRERKA